MKYVVFCGSAVGVQPEYKAEAIALGKEMARRNIGVVYGGAKIGIMGAVADGAMQNGGEVIGVIPHFLNAKEIAHDAITEMISVDSMHERKAIMNKLSDGMITLPGGIGTMEEFFEVLTWGQLGLHKKPIAILNTNGYYDGLIALLETMVDQGFLKATHREMIIVDTDIMRLLDRMATYQAPLTEQWITEERV